MTSADACFSRSTQNAFLRTDFRGIRWKQKDQSGNYCKNLQQGVCDRPRGVIEKVLKNGKILDIF